MWICRLICLRYLRMHLSRLKYKYQQSIFFYSFIKPHCEKKALQNFHSVNLSKCVSAPSRGRMSSSLAEVFLALMLTWAKRIGGFTGSPEPLLLDFANNSFLQWHDSINRLYTVELQWLEPRWLVYQGLEHVIESAGISSKYDIRII